MLFIFTIFLSPTEILIRPGDRYIILYNIYIKICRFVTNVSRCEYRARNPSFSLYIYSVIEKAICEKKSFIWPTVRTDSADVARQ